MDSDPPPLAYAVADDASHLKRRLRRAISGVAIAVGGTSLGNSLWMALATAHILSSDIHFHWTGVNIVQAIVQGLACLAMMVGGLMLWCDHRVGLWSIRAGAAACVLSTLAGTLLYVGIDHGPPPSQPDRWQDRIGSVLAEVSSLVDTPAVLLWISLAVRHRPANASLSAAS